MGEVRKANVIYFLSRMGHVEHPHLLRVQHLSRNGVFLRDVKRWLADLRGNEMPEAFSWSCKRRYKNGYVWQDLIDDDLITPISDNEYVLKGSEIIHNSPCRQLPFEEKKAWEPRKSEGEEQHQPSAQQSVQIDSSRKSTSEIYRESPVFGSERSTTTDESTMNEDETSVSKKPKDFHPVHNKDMENGSNYNHRPSVSSSSTYTRTKSYSNGASQMFRNLMTCGGADANDAVLIPLKQSSGDKIGGSSSTRVFRNSREDEHQHTARKSFDAAWSCSKEKIECCKPKKISAASKPGLAPFCSQCGKSFRPEKMHSHMKSCRGMKALAKIAATSDEKPPLKQHKTSLDKESTKAHSLAVPNLK